MKQEDNKLFLFSYHDIGKLAEWYTKFPNFIQGFIGKNTNKSDILSADKIVKLARLYESM